MRRYFLPVMLIFILLACSAFAESGTLSTGLTWSTKGTALTLSGEGKIPEFSRNSPAPWKDLDITTIKMDDRITSIGDYSFFGCSGLKSVEMSSALTYIGNHAFADCTSLQKIEIPASVKSFGGLVFDNCTSLTEAVFLCEPVRIMGNLFSKCPNVTVKGYERSKTQITVMKFNLKWESLGEYPDIQTVHLTPSDSLYRYIKDHTRIILADGVYTSNADISDLCDVIIEAEHPGKVEFLKRSDSIPVVKIQNSCFIELRGIIMGHISSSVADTQGGCGGGSIAAYSNMNAAQVVSVGSSEYVTIDQCDLWGCGLNAVYLTGSHDVSVKGSILRDCIYGAVYSQNSDATFESCVISGNAYHADYRTKPCIYHASNLLLSFINCIFLNNWNPILLNADDVAEFSNCFFYDNAWQNQEPKEYGVCLGGVIWQIENYKLSLRQDHKFEDGDVLISANGDIPDYSEYSLPWKRYQHTGNMHVDYVLPEDLTRIEDGAFSEIKDKVIRLPAEITYISPTAFDASVMLLVPENSQTATAAAGLGLTVVEEAGQ